MRVCVYGGGRAIIRQRCGPEKKEEERLRPVQLHFSNSGERAAACEEAMACGVAVACEVATVEAWRMRVSACV